MIAALYVQTNGVYYGLDDVDPWDEQRDARLAGFTEARFGYKRGDDGGCFAASLASVREYGGVIEHPAYSAAWDHFNLPEPLWRGGWNLAFDGSASCYIEQGRYGLPVKKATWLYVHGVPFSDLPELEWGYASDGDGDDAGSLDAWRERFGGRSEQWQTGTHRGTHKGVTATTPPAFRDALIGIARSASQVPV